MHWDGVCAVCEPACLETLELEQTLKNKSGLIVERQSTLKVRCSVEINQLVPDSTSGQRDTILRKQPESTPDNFTSHWLHQRSCKVTVSPDRVYKRRYQQDD
ncbi:hypothetical protein EVAR_71626_1 [Eumeta japonica]|uniref:Uncharacterized protein n=1 Tax=Eumeta variegata TaxID=151549 RepID=A0A4C2ABT8_EUMVA|nr:hypothetical protein EVAR_71626_1 [Eumeta japonica]